MSIAIKMGAGIIVVAGAMALVGCGGDDSSTASSTAATTETSAGGGTSASGGGASETVPVSETDFKLTPADPTVKAGTVTFEVSNDGQTTHSLEVEGPGEEASLDQDLAPGDKGTLEVDLSKPGTYEWYCPVDSHREQGMEGEITVQ